MAEQLATFAGEFRAVMKLPEGPEVETGLYKSGTKSVCDESIIAVGSWKEVLMSLHKCDVDDQFIPPLVRVDSENTPVGLVKDGDVVIYWDFRTDRAKPMTAAFLDVPFGGQMGGLSEIAAEKRPDVKFITMTHYDDAFNASPKLLEAFNPAEPLEDTYAEVIGRLGIDQLIVAETEKWRAVTWFKDGRRNLGYERVQDDGLYRIEKHPTLPIEVRVVYSRKVSAHVEAPQMRALEITDLLLDGVRKGVTDMFTNYANADMVGHATTKAEWFDKTIEAILVLDEQLGRLVPEALKEGYTVMITGDHGNAEQMLNKSNGRANPAHTSNKVPFIILGLKEEEKGLKINENMAISDMAPTALALRGIPMPESWDRASVLSGDSIVGEKSRKILRIILDGYGLNEDAYGNAMAQAAIKKGSDLHMDRWMKGEDGAISAAAEASGPTCGYPEGVSGTTEFGHVLFDAGRDVATDLVLIDKAVAKGKFESNKAFTEAVEMVKTNGATIHLMGILSDGVVHASLDHVDALLKMLSAKGVPSDNVSVHVITDGRDVAGDSSPKYIEWLEGKLSDYKVGQINSVWGRAWGKDRDNRWKRIETAFRSMTEGTAFIHVKMN